MTKSIGIEDARKILGDLVTAAQYGHTTTLTRNGKPAARIVPIEEPATMDIQSHEIDIDPATVTRLDGREDWDPILGIVWCRMTVGTAPDGTPVVVLEERLTEDGERDASARLAVQEVRAYDSIEDARRDRDAEIVAGYLPRDIPGRIRDVSA